MNRSLAGRVAVITGSGAGIGLASALIFAARGASVVIADVNQDAARAAAADVAASGGEAVPFTVDVSSELQVKALVEFTMDTYGAIDILFNNAAHVDGATMRADQLIADFDPGAFETIMRVNVMGPMLGVKHAVPHMIAAGGGVVLTTTSLSGYLGQFRESVYGTSKSALHGFVRYVATQYGRFGVRSVGIAPGCCITEDDAIAKGISGYLPALKRHTPYRRLGRPEDIGHTAAFLASDEAAYINGITILVDGGFSAHFPSYADDLDEMTRTGRWLS